MIAYLLKVRKRYFPSPHFLMNIVFDKLREMIYKKYNKFNVQAYDEHHIFLSHVFINAQNG